MGPCKNEFIIPNTQKLKNHILHIQLAKVLEIVRTLEIPEQHHPYRNSDRPRKKRAWMHDAGYLTEESVRRPRSAVEVAGSPARRGFESPPESPPRSGESRTGEQACGRVRGTGKEREGNRKLILKFIFPTEITFVDRAWAA
jgi:hypothetical protein